MTLFRSTVWLNDPKHFNIVFGGSLAAFRPRLSNGLPCLADGRSPRKMFSEVHKSVRVSLSPHARRWLKQSVKSFPHANFWVADLDNCVCT